MGNLERFKIDLKGMKTDNEDFHFVLDDDYFDSLDTEEVSGGNIDAYLNVKKTGDEFLLTFQIEGNATVTCDLCLEPMSQYVETESQMVARFGDSYSEDGDDITVPADDGTIDVSWLFYELTALAIPTRHVHDEGQCDPEMLRRISELVGDDEQEETTDSRWSALEQLKSTTKE